MKSMLQSLAARMARSDRSWRLCDRTFLRVSRAFEWQREMHEDQVRKRGLSARTLELFPDLVVRHGPFSGLRYPWAEAAGSPLFGKILGSYERELSPLFEQVCSVPYPEILNIGSAEGYYAVGLAKRIPGAQVVAYDINPEARRLVRELADANGVGERVTVEGECNPQVLRDRCRGKRGLILSDCEGYERILFSPEVVRDLSGWDVLIEVHDLIDIGISGSLLAAFAGQPVVRIQSVDDIQKAQTYDYAELSGMPVDERRRLLGEGRRSVMEWFLMGGPTAPGGSELCERARNASASPR